MASPILISKNGEYFIEDFPVNKMVERVGSPFYVYSKEKLITNFNSFKSYFNEIDHLICFAVKSNSNIGILNILAEIGAGFDIQEESLEKIIDESLNSLEIVTVDPINKGPYLLETLKAGIDPKKLFFLELERQKMRLG